MTKARQHAQDALVAAMALCKLNGARREDPLDLPRARETMAVASTRSVRAMARIYNSIATGGRGIFDLPRRYLTLAREFWDASKPKERRRKR